MRTIFGSYFYFTPDAADNFLERELGMKRGVSGGYISPFMSIHDWKLGKNSAYWVIWNYYMTT